MFPSVGFIDSHYDSSLKRNDKILGINESPEIRRYKLIHNIRVFYLLIPLFTRSFKNQLNLALTKRSNKCGNIHSKRIALLGKGKKRMEKSWSFFSFVCICVCMRVCTCTQMFKIDQSIVFRKSLARKIDFCLFSVFFVQDYGTHFNWFVKTKDKSFQKCLLNWSHEKEHTIDSLERSVRHNSYKVLWKRKYQHLTAIFISLLFLSLRFWRFTTTKIRVYVYNWINNTKRVRLEIMHTDFRFVWRNEKRIWGTHEMNTETQQHDEIKAM